MKPQTNPGPTPPPTHPPTCPDMLNMLLVAPPPLPHTRLQQVWFRLRFTTCVIFNTNRVFTHFLITCYAALWIFIIEHGTVEAAIDLEIHRERAELIRVHSGSHCAAEWWDTLFESQE